MHFRMPDSTALSMLYANSTHILVYSISPIFKVAQRVTSFAGLANCEFVPVLLLFCVRMAMCIYVRI